MPDDAAADLRVRLIDRIRNDDSFAEALIKDPVLAIEESDLGEDFKVLNESAFKTALSDPLKQVLIRINRQDPKVDLSEVAWSNGCCITVIY